MKNEHINAFGSRVVRALGFTGMGDAKPTRDHLFKDLRAGRPVDWDEILRRAPNPARAADSFRAGGAGEPVGGGVGFRSRGATDSNPRPPA